MRSKVNKKHEYSCLYNTGEDEPAVESGGPSNENKATWGFRLYLI
jgi:hypothetical protein